MPPRPRSSSTASTARAGRSEAELPEIIETEDALDEVLTRPRPELVEFVRGLESPLVVLGAGGKMGPTLAVLARRAAEAAGSRLEVVAASRFGDERARRWLEERGVRALRCDLLDPGDLARLPDSASIIYLAGQKFGTALDPAATWALNAIAPARAAERYRGARIAALSTGNVYPLVPASGRGAAEDQPPAPVGEYAWSCLARERIFEHFSARDGTRIAIIRLNYAVELRYGVLLDLAGKVRDGEPIDLSMGHFNCIWQGDANAAALRALALADSPPAILNLTGLERLSVRQAAVRLGELLGRAPRFRGREGETALLSDAARAARLLGQPAVPLDAALRWTAHWVRTGGRTLGKPTRFEVRDGNF